MNPLCSGSFVIAVVAGVAGSAAAQTNTFPSSGNVGIGTTSPGATLELDGTELIAPAAGWTGGQSAALDLGTAGVGGAQLETTFGGSLQLTNYHDITFQSSNAGAGVRGFHFLEYTNEVMTIGSTGNVGIGTTSPWRGELNVNGSNASLASTVGQLSVSTNDPVNTDIGGSLIFGAIGDSSGNQYPTGYIAGRRENSNNLNLASYLQFGTSDAGGGANECMRITSTGNVGIGTTDPAFPLSVNGTVEAKEVIVQTGWSDYVFNKGYRLEPLSEVEKAIEAENHLPGIPSASEVAAHGVNVGEMEAKLLAKVEELTLRQIDQEKRIGALERENDALRMENAKLEKLISLP